MKFYLSIIGIMVIVCINLYAQLTENQKLSKIISNSKQVEEVSRLSEVTNFMYNDYAGKTKRSRMEENTIFPSNDRDSYDFTTLDNSVDSRSMQDTTVFVNSNVTFHIVVENLGNTMDISPVKWVCTGGILNSDYDETTDSLSQYVTEHHIFTPVWTAPDVASIDTVYFYTDHTLDENRTNDTTAVVITTIESINTFPYFEGFENTIPATSGGIITTDGDYTIHTFNYSGTFISSYAGEVEVLVVGGGGGAVSFWTGGGGAGAGGYIHDTSHTIYAQTYPITIGNGGSVGQNCGGNSIFDNMIAIGGGYGGGQCWASCTLSGGDGGSGGGAGMSSNSSRGHGTSGQGHHGGSCTYDNAGGGGGGAGGQGFSTFGYYTGGNGGPGIYNSITGTSIGYAGGGAGAGDYWQTPTASCGGGSQDSPNGTPNTGGGAAMNGSGGSGIVVIRYLTSSQELETTFPHWSETDVNGTSGDWEQGDGTHHPTGGSVHNGSSLAWFNSHHCSSGSSTRLESPNLDLENFYSAYIYWWQYHDTDYPDSDDRIQIQVNDGVNGWVDVGNSVLRYDDFTGWQKHVIDLSSYAGQAVNVGFLGISDSGNDIHIDNVAIAPNYINADFSADITFGYVPLEVNFTDESYSNPISWQWDIDYDGDYDYFEQNPTHIYPESGIYSVKLKVSDGSDVDSLIMHEYITVENFPPAPPDSINVNLIYPDAIISWSAVDTTIFGTPITPNGYIVLYNETAYEDEQFYYFLDFTTATTYTHTYVAQYREQMFYNVVAIVNYTREEIDYLESLNNSLEKIKWSDIKQNLNEILK